MLAPLPEEFVKKMDKIRLKLRGNKEIKTDLISRKKSELINFDFR